MPLYAKTLASLLSVVLMTTWAMFPARYDVLVPRVGMPTIARPGDTIQSTVRSSVPFWHPNWQVSLEQHGQRTTMANAHLDADFNTTTISFALPASLNAGAYSVVISDGTNEVVRPKAVHVVKKFPEQVSIVQMADLPTLGADGDGDQRLQQIVDEINIINPDLVLMTGDVAYGGRWDQYRRLLAAMESINAPVIAAPGNHEYEGWAGYLTLLGAPYHSVNFGNLQIISLNSGHGRDQLTETQYAWLQHTLQKRNGRIPLVQIHHPVRHRPELHGFVAAHVQDMVTMFKEAKVSIVLSGHWHGDAVYDETNRERRDTWNFPGVPYVITTTAGADLRKLYSTSPLHHGYRLIRLDHGELKSYTYDMDGNGERDATSSIPMGKLRIVQRDTNNIVIKNELNESFPHAHAVIKVPGERPDLIPDQGRIAARYREDDATVYVIEVPLPANTQQQIHLMAKEQMQ